MMRIDNETRIQNAVRAALVRCGLLVEVIT